MRCLLGEHGDTAERGASALTAETPVAGKDACPTSRRQRLKCRNSRRWAWRPNATSARRPTLPARRRAPPQGGSPLCPQNAGTPGADLRDGVGSAPCVEYREGCRVSCLALLDDAQFVKTFQMRQDLAFGQRVGCRLKVFVYLGEHFLRFA